MRIGIPTETQPGERRVAASPESVEQLIKLGFTVVLEAGAGMASHFHDDAYIQAGAEVLADGRAVWSESDVVIKVMPPAATASGEHEADLMKPGATLISFLWPARNEELMQRLAARGINVLAMDAVPRISRAQKLDALSSMANIAGYRAVIEAAEHFGRFFTGQITAAGKIPPAKVMVIGAGVAGLSALGTAAGLGAIVRAFDTRPEVREQVESMGAEFLEVEMEEDGSGEGGYAKVMSEAYIEAEMALFAEQAREVDIIITTALIPGKPAPRLITEDMVKSMAPGSVVVDLAAEQGGNCACTVAGEVTEKHGVTIIGYTDLPSRLATQASRLYATNIRHLLAELTPDKDGNIVIDMEDEVIRGTTVVNAGEITWPPPPPRISATPAKPKPPPPPVVEKKKHNPLWNTAAIMGVLALVFAGVGATAPPEFLNHFTVFVLSCFIGYKVVWSVTPSLHTPLISVTNAISGIIVVGALLQISGPPGSLVTILAFIAVLISTINIAGGFLVTQRMLGMFRKQDD